MSLPKDPDLRPTLEGAIQRIVDHDSLALEDHPSTERWVEYQEGLLEEGEEEELQEHLVVCRVCRSVVLSLAQAPSSPSANERHETLAAPPAPNVTSFPSLPRQRRFTVLAGWLAASLATIALLTGYMVYRSEISRFQDQIASLSAQVQGRAPEFDLTLMEAVPEEVRVRGTEDESLPRLSSGGTLALELPNLSASGEVILAILASAKSSKGAIIAWSTKISARDERFGALRIPPSSLPPGEYTAQLSEVRDDQQTILATYRFVIESSTATP